MPVMPGWMKRIWENEDTRYGIAGAWLIGVPIWSLAAFYFTTIINKRWVIDYQPVDIVRGGFGALVGMAIGIAFAIAVTVVYPRIVESDPS